MSELAKPSQLLRSLVNVAGSAAAARVSSVLFGIAIRRVLGPQLIGVWNMLDIAANYLSALTVGFSFSLERLLPTYRRRGDTSEMQRQLGLVFTWNVGETVFVAVGVAVFLALRGDTYDPTVRSALAFLPFLFAAQKLLSLYPLVLRSSKEFGFYASTNFFTTLLDWFLIPCAAWGGLQGLLLGTLLTSCLKLLYYGYVGRKLELFAVRPRFDRQALRVHFPYAPRYAVFKALFALIERLDSLLIGYLLGPAGLGYYYLGYRLASAALEIPHALVYVAYPHLVESAAYGTRRFEKEFDRFLRITLFVVLPVTMPLGYFGAEFAIRQFLPAFVPGIPAAKILMLAVGLQALRQLYYRAFMVHARIGTLGIVSAIYVPLFLLFFVIARFAQVDALVAAAGAALAAQMVSLTLLYSTSLPFIGTEGPSGRAVMLASHLPLLACLVAVDVIAPGDMSGTLIRAAFELIERVALFGAVALLFAYFGLGRNVKAVAAAVRSVFKARGNP